MPFEQCFIPHFTAASDRVGLVTASWEAGFRKRNRCTSSFYDNLNCVLLTELSREMLKHAQQTGATQGR